MTTTTPPTTTPPPPPYIPVRYYISFDIIQGRIIQGDGLIGQSQGGFRVRRGGRGGVEQGGAGRGRVRSHPQRGVFPPADLQSLILMGGSRVGTGRGLIPEG